jgi:hypothetical protein
VTQLSRSTTACHDAGWASSITRCASSDIVPAARAAPTTRPASIRRRRVASAPTATTTGATTAATWARPMAAMRAGAGSRPTARMRSACMPPRVSVATAARKAPAAATATPAAIPGRSTPSQRVIGRGRSSMVTPSTPGAVASACVA